MSKKFYITTPIYYVNAAPHIGHSYTSIAADTLARYMRDSLGKENVRFLTGTDEHGQKIQRAAQAQGLTPQEFTDKVVVQFKELWEKLNISYDDFIRTTEERHVGFVRQAMQKLYGQGDVYAGKYEGWYCIPDETFWPETQITDQLCPDCKRPLEKISETNYFLKMSKYQDWLIEYINTHPEFIRPENRRNEVLSFLTLNKLTDLCISRPEERLSWGIPLPFDPKHVTYVWFDALLNYTSAVGRFNPDGTYVSDWWGPEANIVHLIGKDILRHHTIYWPIMLHALGIRLPTTIFAHGWWMVGEDKMSKSRGNVVNPLEMVDKYGIDVYRYFLLRDVPFGLDGNFSEEGIIKRFNSDLANDLGNLVFRTLTMVEKYYQGKIPPEPVEWDEASKKIVEKISGLAQEVKGSLQASADFSFGSSLNAVWELINLANKHVEEKKPWNLAKEKKDAELSAFIHLLVKVIREVTREIAPFLPRTSGLIAEQIGEAEIKKGKPLFPRIV